MMRGARSLVLCSGLLVLTVVLAGCAGSSGSDGRAVLGKIQEYVGDGHGDTKLWPALLNPAASGVEPQAVATLLSLGANAVETTVPASQTNWFRLPAFTTSKVVVVTLQPTADEDSDLFLLWGRADLYAGAGDDCLAYSNRLPANQSDPTPVGGFAPDWVYCYCGALAPDPGAQIAVYGVTSGSATKRFRVEADLVSDLTMNGSAPSGLVAQFQSRWYRFSATNGLKYKVTLTATAGDPDLYAYRDSSREFVAGNTATGSGTVTFTAGETGWHYLRIYGYSSATSNFTIGVTRV